VFYNIVHVLVRYASGDDNSESTARDIHSDYRVKFSSSTALCDKHSDNSLVELVYGARTMNFRMFGNS
jgi:hypothetical protein